MAIESFPFDNQLVSEAQFSRMFARMQATGVVPAGLAVTADSSGMAVRVAPGEAFVRGHFFGSTAPVDLPIATSGASPRIDLVVLRLDPAEDSIGLAVRAGVPQATPIAPVPVQTETGVFELPLAWVSVGAGVVTIATANVADRRTWTSGGVGQWTSEHRPETGAQVALGFNHTLGAMEFWNGSRWLKYASLDTPFAGSSIRIEGRPPAAADGVDGDIWLELQEGV